MFGERGVTLVALIITLIIIFILAGLGLGIMTNEGGLFARAFQATIEYNHGAEKEAGRVTEVNEFLDQYE